MMLCHRLGVGFVNQSALDPRMRALYVNYTSTLLQGGVDIVVQFTSISPYSRYGSWGLKLASDQPDNEAPKYLGFRDFLLSNQSCAIPDYTGCPNNCSGNGQCLANGQCFCDYRFTGPACDVVRVRLRGFFVWCPLQPSVLAPLPSRWTLCTITIVGTSAPLVRASAS